jgi:polyisoprenoid-binding protein YceI
MPRIDTPRVHVKSFNVLPRGILAGAALLLGTPLAAASQHLKLDPAASQVTFDARVNIGIDSFTGTVETWTLDLTVPAGSDRPDHAVFTCDVLAMKTGKDKRDEKMREWLESGTFSNVRYEMQSIRESAEGLQADGELTIHGQTQSITIPITVERAGDQLTVKGEITLDYRNFDLKVVRMAGFVTVKPEVKVAFVATGTLE